MPASIRKIKKKKSHGQLVPMQASAHTSSGKWLRNGRCIWVRDLIIVRSFTITHSNLYMQRIYMLSKTDLGILATHPTHHGRGIASQLLKWGLERADRDGLEMFLSASPAGRPIYEKKGFRVVEMEEFARGYVQAYMLRGQGTGGGV